MNHSNQNDDSCRKQAYEEKRPHRNMLPLGPWQGGRWHPESSRGCRHYPRNVIKKAAEVGPFTNKNINGSENNTTRVLRGRVHVISVLFRGSTKILFQILEYVLEPREILRISVHKGLMRFDHTFRLVRAADRTIRF